MVIFYLEDILRYQKKQFFSQDYIQASSLSYQYKIYLKHNENKFIIKPSEYSLESK